MRQPAKSHYDMNRLLRLIRDARSTKAAGRALLTALAMRMDAGLTCRSSATYEKLAQDTQCDTKTLQRTVKALCEEGLLAQVVRPTRSNVFYINVTLLEQQKEEQCRRDLEKKAAKAGASTVIPKWAWGADGAASTSPAVSEPIIQTTIASGEAHLRSRSGCAVK